MTRAALPDSVEGPLAVAAIGQTYRMSVYVLNNVTVVTSRLLGFLQAMRPRGCPPAHPPQAPAPLS